MCVSILNSTCGFDSCCPVVLVLWLVYKYTMYRIKRDREEKQRMLELVDEINGKCWFSYLRLTSRTVVIKMRPNN